MEYTAEDFNHDGLYVQPQEVRHYNYLVEKAVAEGFLPKSYRTLTIFKPIEMEIEEIRNKVRIYYQRLAGTYRRNVNGFEGLDGRKSRNKRKKEPIDVKKLFPPQPKVSIFQAPIRQYQDLKFDMSRMFDQVRVNMKAILQQVGSIEGRKEFETGLHYAYISAIRNQDNKLIGLDMTEYIQKELMQAYQKAGVPMALPFELSGLAGGQLAPEQDKKAWVKPVVITTAVVAGGFAAYKGFEHLKKKGHLSGLSGTSNNKGLAKLKRINARAKQIQQANPRMKWTTAIKKASQELR